METKEAQAVDTHVGTVVLVKGGCAVVHFSRVSMCAHCGACMTFGEKEMETVVWNDLNAVPGDRVTVSLTAKSILKAGIIAYVIPLVALLLGVYLGSLVAEWLALVAGLVSCGLAYLVLHLLDKGFRRQMTFLPRMTAIVTEENETL